MSSASFCAVSPLGPICQRSTSGCDSPLISSIVKKGKQSDPCAFWQWYIQLQQAEAAFRTGKSDLWLRPVFHQKTESAPAVPTSTGKKADQSAPRSRPNALQANPVQRQTSQLEYDGVVCGTLSSSVCPAEHSRSPSATRRTISLIASDRLRLTPCSPIFPISTQTPLRVATLR
jgi:hypothetical protein